MQFHLNLSEVCAGSEFGNQSFYDTWREVLKKARLMLVGSLFPFFHPGPEPGKPGLCTFFFLWLRLVCRPPAALIGAIGGMFIALIPFLTIRYPYPNLSEFQPFYTPLFSFIAFHVLSHTTKTNCYFWNHFLLCKKENSNFIATIIIIFNCYLQTTNSNCFFYSRVVSI